MPHFTDLTGLAGIASATVAAVQQLPGMTKLVKTRQAWLLLAVFVLMLIPFGGMPLAAYVRGVTGDLSITTLVLVWCALSRPWRDLEPKHRHSLLAMIALAALVLYPMALGVGAYDTYRLGYGAPLFVAALLVISLIAWFRWSALLAFCIALAALAWATGWYESDNLWDYLIDPFVSVYALATIMICAARYVLKSQRIRSC